MRMRCFKAYDVRALVPSEFNEDIAYRIGRALAEFTDAHHIVVGRDLRHSGLLLESALCQGIVAAGCNVRCLGVCATEEMYFATASSGAEAGAMITASHNPLTYNGIKMVRAGARPIFRGGGLDEIETIATKGDFKPSKAHANIESINYQDEYIKHILSFVNTNQLKPLRVVSNAGNSSAGLLLDRLAQHLPFEWIKLNHEPDGRFPKGVPNPMLEEHRTETKEAVRTHKADMGIAWDGDCDRCFFFDEHGEFIESYYVVGLLAEYFLSLSGTDKQNHAKVVHDARLIWNTQEIIERLGGEAIVAPAGHSYIKNVMREHNAVYGGEMSAHHYFRDFFYCDSGMVPWLIMGQLLSTTGRPLSVLLGERQARFPISGEISCATHGNSARVLAMLEQRYGPKALSVKRIDGLSFCYADWRFNVRASNTEPLLRLNVETRGDISLLHKKTKELRLALGNNAE